MGDKNQFADIESDYRFYKKRDISRVPQSEWLYPIFKYSMNAKIKANGLIIGIFLAIQIVYCEICITLTSSTKVVVADLAKYRNIMLVSNDRDELTKTLALSDSLYNNSKADINSLYNSFNIIHILSYLNMTFLVQHLIQFIFAKKLGRFYAFPSGVHFTDSVLFATSVLIIKWF